MKDLQIIKQLLSGNHLNETELKEAENLVYRLNTEIESRKPKTVEFTRVNSDSFGNPRYVCHFLNLSDDYQRAIKIANSIGGRKFNNKQYGGGLVFQSYNTNNLQKLILELKEN